MGLIFLGPETPPNTTHKPRQNIKMRNITLDYVIMVGGGDGWRWWRWRWVVV